MTSEYPIVNVPTVDNLPKPPETDIPGFCAETNLPKGLLENPQIVAVLQLGVTQWSRIAAWTWCNYLAFKDSELEDKEQKLKNTLIQLLTSQSSNADGYLNYAGDSEAEADDRSQEIVKQLLANNLEHWKEDGKDIKDWTTINPNQIALDKDIQELTLSDVLIKTTGQPLVTSVPQNEAFVKLFYVQVTRDAFTGKIVCASDECINPITPYTRYINIIAYPPRPATFIDRPLIINPSTEQPYFASDEQMLEEWAGGWNQLGNYLPPSAYIPIATS